MAIRFMDSFDHYSASQAELKWSTTTVFVIGTGGRFGSCLQHTDNNAITRIALDDQPTWIVGVAFKLTSGNNPPANRQLIHLLDGTTAQVDLRLTNGSLQITRNGTVLGTGTFKFIATIWYYLEFKVTIHNSTGTIAARVNGISDISASGLDTQNTANATASAIQLGATGGVNGAGNPFWDDVYILDGTGSAPTNDFLGDVRVQTIVPNGNGTTNQLDGSDGNQVDNYLLVDEATPNSDTDYVESSDVGDKDTYNYGAITPAAGTVYGLAIYPWARKTDAGIRTIATIARHSATEVDSADRSLSVSYQYFTDIRETKPGGGVWSIADVNAAEFGVKVTT